MAVDVKLPDLGEGIDSGDVLQVLVGEGDVVKKDQGIVELETDKATVEVPSSQAGKVAKVHVKVGQSVAPGDALISVEPDGATDAKKPKPKEKAAARESQPKVEKSAAAEQPKPEKKAAAPKRAAKSKESAPVQPKSAAAQEPQPAASTPAPLKKSQPTAPPSEDDAEEQVVPAGPAVRRFAREVGVDLRQIQGSGESGRITRDDVLSAVREASQKSNQATPTAEARPDAPGQPSTDDFGPIRSEKMPRIRKTIAAKMHQSWTTIPRVTNFDDADVTELEKIRQQSKADYAAAGIKLTAMPFVIKAVSLALHANPTVNASIDLENEQIIYKDYFNIGVAVDTERGLIVPSLRGANNLSISEIARKLAKLAENARSNNFTIEDLQGSTFTISNLGSVGGIYSTPIINPPEAAILLLGRSRKLPVVVGDEVKVRLMMPLSLSYDHRLVDGATAARFLNDVIGFLQSPGRLLMAP